MSPSTSVLLLTMPELVLVAAALGVMLWDLWLPAGRKAALGWASMAVCVALFALTFLPDYAAAAGAKSTCLSGSFVLDPLALFFKRAFCVIGFLVFAISQRYVEDLPQGQGEYGTISLLALLGMFLVSSVNDFMSLFVALETVTVSFFVLAAFRRERATSVEAGLKLLVMGSLSAAILIYGIAFVYGATGTLSFPEIHAGLASGSMKAGSELLLGAMLIFLGLGFKTSAVPLHVWVPDVYQGAPTPVTAYLSVGSKLAGFVLVVRVLTVVSVGPVAPELTAFFALVAALTLFYGNLGAIPQSNVKRLMGYSSIGQCGYILIGIAAASATGLKGALFYMAAYVVMNLAAFAVILVVSRATGSHELEDYAGLARRSPLLGASLVCALLSLAGVPPFIGFFGKFLLVGSAFDLAKPELLFLGAVGLVNVAIALYFYLCVAKRVYVHEPRSPEPLAVPGGMKAVLAASLAALILGGVAPQLLETTCADVVAQLGR